MKSLNSQAIIKKIAREYGYSEKEVYDIVKTPFEFTAKVMREADRENAEFPSIRIKYFLTFYCSKERKEFFKNLNKKLKQDAGNPIRTRETIIPVLPDRGGSDNEG